MIWDLRVYIIGAENACLVYSEIFRDIWGKSDVTMDGWRYLSNWVSFIYFHIYLCTCLFINIITVKGNSSYYISKAKNEYVTANLHWLNSESDSGFRQASRKKELSWKKKHTIKPFFIFLKSPIADIWLSRIHLW